MKLGTINSTIGALGAIAGMICIGAAVAVAFTPQDPLPAPIIQKIKINPEDCKNALTELGYEVESSKPDVFEVTENSTFDAYTKLQRASLAAKLCNKKFTEFCMGDDCSVPGVSFTLTE